MPKKRKQRAYDAMDTLEIIEAEDFVDRHPLWDATEFAESAFIPKMPPLSLESESYGILEFFKPLNIKADDTINVARTGRILSITRKILCQN